MSPVCIRTERSGDVPRVTELGSSSQTHLMLRFCENATELAVYFLRTYDAPGAIKTIQLKRSGFFTCRKSSLLGEARVYTADSQSWKSEMWAVHEAQTERREKERRGRKARFLCG